MCVFVYINGIVGYWFDIHCCNTDKSEPPTAYKLETVRHREMKRRKTTKTSLKQEHNPKNQLTLTETKIKITRKNTYTQRGASI